MDLKSRIDKIGPYFVSFNIMAEESASYAVVKFPQGWAIPDKGALRENFKVEIAPMEYGICFASDIKNGPECIFDALDYVIDFNKKVEERKGLLIEKVEELKQLFATEDLDKLKTLQFSFSTPKKAGRKPQVKKAQAPSEEEQSASEAQPESTPVAEESSLMSMAKSIVEAQ